MDPFDSVLAPRLYHSINPDSIWAFGLICSYELMG
ncbi:hypothetical protein AMTRI_Chr05g57560 [Amborella trichopoda]